MPAYNIRVIYAAVKDFGTVMAENEEEAFAAGRKLWTEATHASTDFVDAYPEEVAVRREDDAEHEVLSEAF